MIDTHMILTLAGIALVGSLIGLDRTAAGQFMISQPIVASPLVGWLLGDTLAGIMIGACLELIWVLDMPIGSFVPADATICAVSATAIAALGSPGGAPLPVIGFSILLTTAMVPVTMKADDFIRHWNSRLADAVMAGPGPLDGHAIARAHLAGLTVFYVKFFVLYLIFIPAGIVAVAVFMRLPDHAHRAMSLFVKLLPLIGVALVARKFTMKTIDVFLLGGFLFAFAAAGIFHAPALLIVLLIVAGGWLGARYSERRA